MPIYSYKCINCGLIFEKFQNSSNNGKVYCSECGSEALRIFTPAGIVFKGKGFYSTDYGSKNSKVSSENKIMKENSELSKENKVKSDSNKETKDTKIVENKNNNEVK